MNERTPGHTQVPNWLFDLSHLLTPAEFKVAMDIARQTYGWHRETDDSSAAQIAERTNLRRPTVANILQRFAELGLIANEPGRRNGYQRRLVAISVDDLSSQITGQVSHKVTAQGRDLSSQMTRAVTSDDRSPVISDDTPKYREKERNIPPPPTPSEAAAAPPIAAGGGGESATRIGRAAAPPPAYPETIAYLQELGVMIADQFGTVPLAVAEAATAQANQKRNADSRPALIASILSRYLRGEWTPPTSRAAAPPPRVSDRPIALYPDLSAAERRRWVARFQKADPAERPAVLASFYQEYPDARPAAAV